MKIFAKIIAIVLAILMISVFAVSCGNGEDTVDGTQGVTDTESVATESETQTDTDTDTESDTKTEIETFEISLGTDNGDGWDNYNDVE